MDSEELELNYFIEKAHDHRIQILHEVRESIKGESSEDKVRKEIEQIKKV